MGATTWLDRITDESNLWLSASKAEEAKEYPRAAIHYLEDAGECFERGSKGRAALSCYCAAECLAAMGATEEAKSLYVQSGKLYTVIADHGVSGSIREALWALQRAYACYVMAEQVKEAEATNDAFKLLARRANPFSGGSNWLEMPKVSPKQRGGQTAPLPAEVKTSTDEFLALCGSRVRIERAEPRTRRTGGMVDDQEGLVSQLG